MQDITRTVGRLVLDSEREQAWHEVDHGDDRNVPAYPEATRIANGQPRRRK